MRPWSQARLVVLGFVVLGVAALAAAPDTSPTIRARSLPTTAGVTAPVATANDNTTHRIADFVTVQKGNLPIIISVPHGGRKKVPDVPERLGKGINNFHTVRDENTAELAERFLVELEKLLKGQVWAVIARFERKYLDVNRAREEGYEHANAQPYYDFYHDSLAAACRAVKKQFGRGILLDIHGQAVHPNAICRGTQNLKTVTRLHEREGLAAIRGRNSILGRLEYLGYPVIPAGQANEKVKEVPAFAGGYIVQTYGSHTDYGIDAIQLEFGSKFRAKDQYGTTALELADAVSVFYKAYLQD
ncbi:MAG: N-formylglutamate amidohydrolase [Gemmataceae bacterium]|nr:N-formylglutamate amidohydrolase [Gemmata sp.]MDW8197215.1 N-formylglutamate amidohydrolase [Gemmataceae bacterium]